MQGKRPKENKKREAFRFVIAGGGTGGHLFPGIAVAGELEDRLECVDILFIVGRRPMEAQILSRYGYHTRSIEVEGITGRGIRRGLGVCLKLPMSIIQSFAAIKAFRPEVVLGVGGYSSGPFCLTARLMRIPTAIHEQNAYPGLTNRLLSRVVDRIFISLDESRGHFSGGKIVLTGNPVRKEFFSYKTPRTEKGKPFCVLVSGGSQGARAVNEIFAEALSILKSRGKPIHVIHQAGQQDFERVKEDYSRKGLKGDIFPFIDDMAGAYRAADMVVSRAGATTLFELAAMGKPCILIPYPFATHHHQEINASSFVQAGGAEMILQANLTADGLAQRLMAYMDDPDRLNRMAARMYGLSRMDAAEQIVGQLLEMAGIGTS